MLDVSKNLGIRYGENISLSKKLLLSSGHFNEDGVTIRHDSPTDGAGVDNINRMTSGDNSYASPESQFLELGPSSSASASRIRPTSACSKTSFSSLGCVDTLALTELEIWAEIDHRLREKYFAAEADLKFKDAPAMK